jgi:hypothetical protein
MATLAAGQRFRARATSLWQHDSTIFLQGITLLLIAFAIHSIIIFSTPGFLSMDDYYHARISEEIITQGRLRLDFPWLPRTILDPKHYVDHHLLYHIVLAPSMLFDDIAGPKVVTAGIGAMAVLVAWVLLRRIGVNYPAIWALGLFCVAPTFILRMLMIRTQGFSFLMLTLGLLFMFERRWKSLAVVSFFYVWLYNGFILMLGFAGLYALARWIEDRSLVWQPLVYCGVGLVLGVVINPYFPNNVTFVFDHLSAKVDLDNSIPVGQEWIDFNTRTWLTAVTGGLASMLFGFVRPYFGSRKRDHVETTLLLCALVTGYMAFTSMRFLEYFPGFALLYAASEWGRGPVITFDTPLYRRYARYVTPLLLVGALAVFAYLTLPRTYNVAQTARDVRDYQGASEWLEANTPTGTMIFPVGFNDFSRMFFYNQHNTWLVGLDPTYLSYADPSAWASFQDIRDGKVERPAARIASVFGLQYVVSGERHQAFNRRASQDPDFEVVFRDEFNIVWKVRDDVYQRLAQNP